VASLDPAALVSRFIVDSDARVDRIVYPLPFEWWSRPYEYAWAMGLCEAGDVALDAGCGPGHPFKFHLADACREAHGCDIDEAMLDPRGTLKKLAAELRQSSGLLYDLDRYATRLVWTKGSVTALPYADATFDKVYCLSVLEHLSPQDMSAALGEFARVVRPQGLVALTFDYPTVNLGSFVRQAQAAGLKFAGPVTLVAPRAAIASQQWGLRCYRAALRPHRSPLTSPHHGAAGS
jgi:ubiquinone/menaquinone biosynthesis C-methylase UbiE